MRTLATRYGVRLAVMVWHYHDADTPGPAAAVTISVGKLPLSFAGGAAVTRYLVYRNHANAFTAWLQMGSPIAPSAEQRAALIAASRLETVPDKNLSVEAGNGAATLEFELERQGVTLLVLEPQG